MGPSSSGPAHGPGAIDRRGFLSAAALAGTAAMINPSAAGAPTDPAFAARTRPTAGARNLFNGDCNFLFYNPELWQPEGGPFSVRAIERHLGVIADSGVDTLLVNPNTQVAWYPSKGLPHILEGYRRGDRAFARAIGAGLAGMTPTLAESYAEGLGQMLDLYLDLAEAGIDWLAECARISRQRGLRPWLSYRMNPTHFSGAPDSPVNCPPFRDPANRLSGRVPGAGQGTHPAWIGLNYGRPAVRDYLFGLIREGVEGYDYQGLELDWLRHPVCLEAPASARSIDAMTAWFADVRALTRARGRDYPLGLRLPANLAYLRSIGIDVKALVRRNLVDFCTFSNFWQSAWEMPLDELRRELGPEVILYGGMEAAPNWLEALAPSLSQRPAGPDVQLAGDNAFRAGRGSTGAARVRGTRYLTASAELMRANAAGKLVLGAEGLEQFNFFVTDQVRVPGLRANYAGLRQLTELSFLRGQEKHYALNTATVQPTRIWDVPEQLPIRIAPRHRRAFRLPMCGEPADGGLEVVVQVIAGRPAPGSGIGVSLNGAWPSFGGQETEELLFAAGPYTRHVEEHQAWNFRCDCGQLRDGWNEVMIHNEEAADLEVVGLELAIRRRT